MQFTSQGLWVTKYIFERGGPGGVVMERKEQIFRMFYDNRRKFVAPVWFNNSNYHDSSRTNIFLET
jgi:hypothetical protein